MADGTPKGQAEHVFKGPTLERDWAYSISADESRLLAVDVGEGAIRKEIRIDTRFFERLRKVAGPGSRQEAAR